MRSDPVTLTSGHSAAADFTTKGVYLDQIYSFSIQAITTGTAAAGTISLQGSNDNVQPTPGGTDSASLVTNWTDLTGPGTLAVAGAGSGVIDVSGTGIRWVRAKFKATGTDSVGSITINYNGKG